MFNERKLKMLAANKGYFILEKLLKSELLSMRSTSILYSSYFRPVLLYGYELRSVTRGDVEKLVTFERKILRHNYGPISKNGDYRIRTNKEIYQMYLMLNAFIRAKTCLEVQWYIKKVITETMNGKDLEDYLDRGG